jgi:hypothetical protein
MGRIEKKGREMECPPRIFVLDVVAVARESAPAAIDFDRRGARRLLTTAISPKDDLDSTDGQRRKKSLASRVPK